jgi:hypothetical protein
MKAILFASFILFLCIPACDAQTRRAPLAEREQVHFSAEDEGVRRPAALPGDVLEVLGKQKRVVDILESQQIPPEQLPLSWFSASIIHLGRSNDDDFIVEGEPPLSGANTVTFWVFRSTPNGHELVLTAAAHDLIVRKASWNGYRDLEMMAVTAMRVDRVLFRFDGKRYQQYREKLEAIR